MTCLVLAVLVTLAQSTPQRVERVTEYRWCVEAPDAWVERRSGVRVEGKEAGEWAKDRVLRLDVTEPTDFLLTGP